MSSQEVQSLPGVPVNHDDDGNDHDDDNNHGDDDDHDGDYDTDDDGVIVNLSPGQGVHPEPALQPPPRQRGGIGFIAHIEPLMIHDTHEDDNDEYDGGKNSNLRLGENMVTPFVTMFVTKMVTLVTMLTLVERR